MVPSATNKVWLFLAAALAMAVLALALPPPVAKAAEGEAPDAALAGIRGNFSQVWWLDNATKQWQGYDPAVASGNTLASLRQGEAYLIKGVKQQATAVLGGATIVLYPGENYVVWGVAPDPLSSVPIGQALKPTLAGRFSAVWLLDAPSQTWYGYNPALPLPEQGLHWLVAGYAYWFVGVTTPASLTAGQTRSDLYPGSNLVAWPAQARAAAVPSSAPALPNLAPYTPPELEAPLVLSTEQNPRRNSPLSTQSPTWLRFAIANNGTANVAQTVKVSVLLDGKPGPRWEFPTDRLPSKQRYAGGNLSSPLEQSFTIGAGKHRVAVMIDPDNQVQESDEDDNIYEAEFTWLDGPVSAPAPTATPETLRELKITPFPEPTPGTPPPAMANLRPYRPDGWAAPFVFSSKEDDFSGTKPVDLAGPVYFAVAVQSAGNAELTASFDVEVWLDGLPLATLTRTARAMAPGVYGWWSGRDFNRYYHDNIQPTGVLADGSHTITVTVDPRRQIDERHETDNVYVHSFTVAKGAIQPKTKPEPTYPTPVQLKAKLDKLGPLLKVVAPTAPEDGKPSYEADAMEVVESGYYLLTGRTLEQEQREFGLTIAIESRAQWAASIEQNCTRQYETTSPDRYQAVFKSCHAALNGASGYFQHPDELPSIHIRGDYTPRWAVHVLLHELGHFRQWSIQSDRPEGTPTVSHRAMKELQAQAFQAAGVRLLEELTGYNLATYEEVQAWGLVDVIFDGMVAASAGEEHERAALAVWGALLQDPNLVALRWKLTTFGYLDSRGSLDLYTYMISLPWREWAQQIDSYLANQSPTVATAKGIVRSRLVYNLPPDQRPSLDFVKVGLRLP